MLPLPESDWRKPQVLASWLELAALSEDDGVALRGSALEMCRDSQLFADATATRGDDRDNVAEGSAASAIDETWSALEYRARLLDDAWPFELTENTLGRVQGKQSLESVAAYTTVALIEAAGSKWYSRLRIDPGDRVRTWFEHIAVAALRRLVAGETHRFGSPFPHHWPKPFPDRVKFLAGLFGVDGREHDIAKHASQEQKDDSLDVVARFGLRDEEPGTPYFLVQCATGANWRSDKPGQPTMELWQRYIAWNGPIYKALAIPFTLREKGELENASVRHGNAVVFDRLRICAGLPDESIDPELRSALSNWCKRKFHEITGNIRSARRRRPAPRSKRASRGRRPTIGR